MQALSAVIRTFTAAIVAWVAAKLLLAGIAVDEAALEAVVYSVLTGAVTWVWFWASSRWPIFAKIVSFFTSPSAPRYEQPQG